MGLLFTVIYNRNDREIPWKEFEDKISRRRINIEIFILILTRKNISEHSHSHRRSSCSVENLMVSRLIILRLSLNTNLPEIFTQNTFLSLFIGKLIKLVISTLKKKNFQL